MSNWMEGNEGLSSLAKKVPFIFSFIDAKQLFEMYSIVWDSKYELQSLQCLKISIL